ncbi:MAG: hypothetical protein PHH98_05365 [Candidatus Gracilibacteria bacterium]|nr:hypothetical protein [Candidatus Gracilibacteria bacterium]
MKKYLEIFIVISILLSIIYTILYFFYFDSFCSKFSGIEEKNYSVILNNFSACTDTFVCNITDIERDERTQVKTWKCIKKEVFFKF